jgi:serine protease Do
MRVKFFFALGGGVIGAGVVLVALVGILGTSVAARSFVSSLLATPSTDISQVTAEDLTSRSTAVADMVERVNSAVVSVVVTKDVTVYEQYYEEYNPWGMWGGGFSMPRVREQGTEEREVGGGSGFFVTADGLIVTNRHVVSDTEARYSVLTNLGTSYEVEVLARDPLFDIAILKIVGLEAGTKLNYLSFGDSTALRLGESVVAIGNALAEFRNSVSVGVVSGLARSIVATDGRGESEALRDVIQTDAAINPGNSGGPLLNLAGEVVGVNVATSEGADNIGFALPAHVVKGAVESVEKTGTIARPYIGVRYAMVTEEIKKLNNLSVDYGALIVRGEQREALAVLPGSPADMAGLRENDIILSIDGEELRDKDFATVLRAKTIGQEVVLRVLSMGREKEVRLTLTAAPE